MKISIASLLLLTLGACSVSGSGDVRKLGGFGSVTNQSDADVVLMQPGGGYDSGDVIVACEGGITADVDTSVDGEGNLVIKFAAEVATILGCEVQVVSDEVVEVVSDGDGDIVCDDPLVVQRIEVKGNGSVDLASVEVDQLDILVTGTGSLTIDTVTVDTLNVDLRGAGDVMLGGTAVTTNLLISGGGNFQAQDLTVSGTLDALLDGTGNGAVTVTGTVDAEVHGNAVLDIYGAATEGVITEVDGGTVTFH